MLTKEEREDVRRRLPEIVLLRVDRKPLFALLDDGDELRRLIRRKEDTLEHGVCCECATCLKVDSDIRDVLND